MDFQKLEVLGLLIVKGGLMNCVFCEAPVAAGMRYCPHCGTFLNSPEAAKPISPLKYAPGGSAPETRTSPTLYPGSMPQTSTAAVVSLIAGILTWTLFPILPAIVAVWAGHHARREIQESGGRVTGDAMAVIGLILGYIQVGLIVLGLVLVIGFGGLALLMSLG